MSESAILALIGGVFGAVIGSFLNVCIVRLPAEQSVVSPPSRCPKCGRPVGWRDNIPVFSWLLLRGKCRGCREPNLSHSKEENMPPSSPIATRHAGG